MKNAMRIRAAPKKISEGRELWRSEHSPNSWEYKFVRGIDGDLPSPSAHPGNWGACDRFPRPPQLTEAQREEETMYFQYLRDFKAMAKNHPDMKKKRTLTSESELASSEEARKRNKGKGRGKHPNKGRVKGKWRPGKSWSNQSKGKRESKSTTSQGRAAAPQLFQSTPRHPPPAEADRILSVDPAMRLFAQNPRICHRRERFVIPELDRRARTDGSTRSVPTWTGGDPHENDADNES